MAESDSSNESVHLEVPVGGAAAPSSAGSTANPPGSVHAHGPSLEVSAGGAEALAAALANAPAAPTDNRPKAQGGAWKKRAPSAAQDASIERQLTLLPTETPTLSVLWPELSARELLTEAKPSGESFARRWSELQGAIDAVARKGYEQRAQAAAAQSALEKRKANLARDRKAKDHNASSDPALEALVDYAVEELSRSNDKEFVLWALTIAGAKRALYAQDLLRLEQEAESRGVERARAKDLVRAEGIELHESAARAWSPCVALPDAPQDMDGVGKSLLAHPSHAFNSIKRGAITDWLKANDAPQSMIEVAEEIRRLSDRKSESHVVHTMAWNFGRTELVLRDAWITSAMEIPVLVRQGVIHTEDLHRAARDRVLGVWLRRAGWSAAGTAADALGRDEAFGLERLAWALGEPLRVGDLSFTDPVTLARTALATPSLRPLLERSYAQGELLAWMESLAPSRRDEKWLQRLRKAQEQKSTHDPRWLWAGVYAALGSSAKLSLKNSAGVTLELSLTRQLTATHEVASFWDILKESYRSGELLAWLAAVDPEHDYIDQTRPEDDDSALNELLWELGHVGLIVEWGPNDQAATTPDDLVRMYRLDRQWFEGQLRRGYILRWLERFYGKRLVAGASLEVLVDKLRAEMQVLPSGVLALKCALLCGMRQLPLDPCEPGDPATFFGYVGVTNTPSSAEAWEPLRLHMTWGAGHLWVAQLPTIKQTTLPLLVNAAFAGSNTLRDAPDRLLKALALQLGSPIPSPALAARLGRVTQTPSMPSPAVNSQINSQSPSLPSSQPKSVSASSAPQVAVKKGSGGWVAAGLLLLAIAAGAIVSLKLMGDPLHWFSPAPRPTPQPNNNVSTANASRCVITHPRVELAVGSAGAMVVDRGLSGVSVMNEFDFAWIKPGQNGGASTEGAGFGWARIAPDGAVQHGSATSELIDPHTSRGQVRQVFHVFAMEGRSVLGGRVAVDQWIHGDDRRDIVGCGRTLVAQQLPNARGIARTAALNDPTNGARPGAPDLGATFYCRSIGEVVPLVVGARGVIDTRGTLMGAELYVSGDPTLVARRSLGSWPVDLARARRASNPMTAMREEAPSSVESATSNGTRVIVATGRDRVLGWLDRESSRSVPLAMVLAQQSEPGPARVAINENTALVVWVDHQPRETRRTLIAAKVNLYGSFQRFSLSPFGPSTGDPLQPANTNRSSDPVLASLAALADGGWLIAWIQRVGTNDTKTVWLQRYSAELQPMGTPLMLTPNVSVATARLVYDRLQGFVLAYTPEGTNPGIFAVRGQCL